MADHTLEYLREEYGFQFPESFVEFQNQPRRAKEYKYGGRRWWMVQDVDPSTKNSGESLYDPTSIDRNPKVPFAAILRQYADSCREYFDNDATVDEKGREFAFSRLSNSPAIGFDNGDYLFIDCESQGIYIFHHDGSDVEQIAPSFERFIAKAKPVDR